MAWAIQLIKDLCASKFYGKVIITFNCGRPVHAEKQISILPPEDKTIN